MPLKIVKAKGKYLVTEPSGKVLGTHETHAKAAAQVAAIEANRKGK